MKYIGCFALGLILAGCCGCFRREVVVVRHEVPSPPPVRTVVVPPVAERVFVKETRSRSLLGHLVVGTTLVLADAVSLVFPVEKETTVLRERFWSGGF